MTTNANTNYFIVAKNPDGRVKSPIILTCANEDEVRAQILEKQLDVNSVSLFAGQHLALHVQTVPVVTIGEPKRRRGRPPGSKNLTAAERAERKKSKRASGRRAKSVTADSLVKISKRGRKSARRSKGITATDVLAAAGHSRGKRAKESQADRNARVETTA